jgi:hypothetical protein
MAGQQVLPGVARKVPQPAALVHKAAEHAAQSGLGSGLESRRLMSSLSINPAQSAS